MVILIDGYNLLHRIISDIDDVERQRTWLIKVLTAYARKKKNNLLIVFDGGLFYWPSEQEKSKYVSIVFSGKKMSADDYLKDYILEHTTSELLLVTDDRAIADVAHEHDMPSIGSKHFYNLVRDALNAKMLKGLDKAQVSKLTTRPEHEEIDALMQEAARMHMPEKSEDTPIPTRKKEQKLSRHEKKIMKLLKKL